VLDKLLLLKGEGVEWPVGIPDQSCRILPADVLQGQRWAEQDLVALVIIHEIAVKVLKGVLDDGPLFFIARQVSLPDGVNPGSKQWLEPEYHFFRAEHSAPPTARHSFLS